MRSYNIYYKNEKINKTPMTREDVDALYSQETIVRAGNNGGIDSIPVNRIRVIERVTF